MHQNGELCPVPYNESSPIMSTSPTPSERERKDKQDREREKEEQAKLPYKWRQTIGDVDIDVPVATNLKGRDFVVEITKSKLKIQIKGQEPIIDVHFCTLRDSPNLLHDEELIVSRCTLG